MGQTVGRMPDTWEELVEEKNRVLHWSSEILAKVQDNVTNEDTFLMDYDDDKVNTKIDVWIKTNQPRIDKAMNKFPNAPDQLKDTVRNKIDKFGEELRIKVWKDYQNAYKDIKHFNKKVDRLGENERKIHADIQELEKKCKEVRKFQKKFGPLRAKVFDNLKTGDKMMFQDKRLKTNFVKKVYNIDHRSYTKYLKRIDKLLKDFGKKCDEQEK
ncbi:uncharacterized protein LOC109853891 [Pseudomyrmex gracilis]|uniref:uncharacterized protein LOC109853891 n=1 Tax=Pseudomyrmex gracilis TaxID=219809 RepID=UPI000994B358|nr:uncharacterized protein LOC109853891 [Pseudomyrmex gracilis]XP_020282035.1 uncharacterized protein LOC109853891 [Pseudomyrmex gracilis]